MRDRRPHEPDRREQVRLDRLAQRLVIELERARSRRPGRVGDEDVEATEPLDRRVDERRGRRGVGHVGGEREDLARQRGRGRVQTPGVVSVDRDPAPFVG